MVHRAAVVDGAAGNVRPSAREFRCVALCALCNVFDQHHAGRLCAPAGVPDLQTCCVRSNNCVLGLLEGSAAAPYLCFSGW